VTHPHKRLQHLAGRFLLQFLFPGFPYELIQIADTRKPYLPEEQYHFSISHCGDYAAAIVSKSNRVGVDVEIPVERIGGIADKFLDAKEMKMFNDQCSRPDPRPEDPVGRGLSRAGMYNTKLPATNADKGGQQPGIYHRDSRPDSYRVLTLLWSAKEAVFKWYGDGEVDFRKHIQLSNLQQGKKTIDCFFVKNKSALVVHYRQFEELVLAWVMS
jgi:phosphopantetheinyl transferase